MARVRDEADGLDVQLVRDKGRHLLRQGGLALDVHGGKGLADLEVCGVARGAAEVDGLEHELHLILQRAVDEALVRRGEGAQVHGFRLALVHLAHEVLVDGLRKEGRKGRGELGQGHKDRVERLVSGELVLRHAAAPVAVAAAAHVPVGELVHKVGQGAGRLGDLVGIQVLIHGLDERVELGEDPAVHDRARRGLGIVLGVEVVDVGVEHEEGVGVPERAHVLALQFAYRLVGEAGGQPRRGRGVEVPAHGVRALLVQHVPGRDDVAQVLAHLDAVLVLHKAQHHAVLKRVAVKEQGGDGQQRVEPAAGLVHGLGDELGRKVLLEDLLVLKGVVPLRKGHGAAVVPAVDDLGHAVHDAAALLALKGDLVHIGLVQLDVLGHVVAPFAQLRLGADDVRVAAVVADPDRQRRAPVALAREAPVDDVLQEVAHAAFLDVVREPVDAAVVLHELVAHGGHLDEPGGAGVVEQGRVAPPAEGVGVRVRRGGKELAAGLEVLDDEGIGVFYEHAGPGGHRVDKAALGVDQLHKGQVVLAAHARVVLAEGRRGVDDARAVGEGDVVVRHNVPAALAGLAGKGIERLVLRADELGALDGPQHLRPLAHDLLAQGLGQDVGLAVLFGVDVVLVLVYDQRDVGGQGPGRGGPGQKEGVLLTADTELDVDARLGYVLIALGDLVGGQRRAAARAVGHDLVALVEQALVRDGLQRPPDGLDVVVVVGDVGMLHVRPVADAVAHLLPLGLVLPDGFLALLDEGLDAVLLDLGLAVDAQGLFDLQLHGQAVGVPAGLAEDLVALHGLVARDQVLDGARLHVADVGPAVGRGRAVEEREDRRALALGERLFHDAVRAPELQDLLLALDEVQRRGYLVVHERHSSLRHKKRETPPRISSGRSHFPRYHPSWRGNPRPLCPAQTMPLPCIGRSPPCPTVSGRVLRGDGEGLRAPRGFHPPPLAFARPWSPARPLHRNFLYYSGVFPACKVQMRKI